jgi:hypothetical protein
MASMSGWRISRLDKHVRERIFDGPPGRHPGGFGATTARARDAVGRSRVSFRDRGSDVDAVDHMILARESVEDVYRLDLRGAFKDPANAEARRLVHTRLASGAAFLRDLAYTAWIETAKPVPPGSPIDRPNNPENPRYNPATGSAPAPAAVHR